MADVTLTIDGRQVTVPAGTSIFDAARLYGIPIPTLCHLQSQVPVGVCRLCVVDVGGRTSGADTTGLMAGITVCTEHYAVDIVTATTTLIVTGVANRHVRICSINLVTAAANNVALIAGTGATCGTSTAGINGGTTAAEGWNLAANGGLAQGSGLGEIMSTKVSGGATGDSVCIVTSAATQLSGTMSVALF